MGLDEIIREKFPKEFKKLEWVEKDFLCKYEKYRKLMDNDDVIARYNTIVTKLLNLNKQDRIPKHFFDNLLNYEQIKVPKLEFGNEDHIAIADGSMCFPSNWYK